jgi:hypothetical protein
VDSGLTITAPYARLVNWFVYLADDVRCAGRPPLRSVIDRSVSEWEHELIRERARRRGKLGWPKFGTGVFRRSYRHLLIAYDPREWWQHDAWSPRFDARIPLRDHEPAVARAGYDFTVIEQPWLRDALKWQLKTALETGRLRWTSVLARLVSLTAFSRFIAERGIDEPRLCADRAELRLLALDYLAHVKQRRARCGANRGQLVTNGTVRHQMNHLERFYAFMVDHKEEAARALGEPRWLALGDGHARLWRPGEKPLPPRGCSVPGDPDSPIAAMPATSAASAKRVEADKSQVNRERRSAAHRRIARAGRSNRPRRRPLCRLGPGSFAGSCALPGIGLTAEAGAPVVLISAGVCVARRSK